MGRRNRRRRRSGAQEPENAPNAPREEAGTGAAAAREQVGAGSSPDGEGDGESVHEEAAVSGGETDEATGEEVRGMADGQRGGPSDLDDAVADQDRDGDASRHAPLIEDDEIISTDVREVLAEIGAEGEIARVESRIQELEREIRQTAHQVEEAARARRGEMEVMRARVEDGLELVESTTGEQREAWSQLEQRLAALVSEVEAGAGRLVSSLREELTPRVHRVSVQTEEMEARLRGEIESAVGDTRERLDAVAGKVDANRAAMDDTLADLRGTLTQEVERQARELRDLEERVTGRVEEVTRVRSDEISDRVEALRRELDAAVGELRAAQNLRAQTLEELVTEVRNDLEAHVRTMERREADWVEATREAVRRAAEAENAADALVERERDARLGESQQLRERLDELGERLEQVDGRAASQTGRHLAELGQLHRQVEELNGRVEVLASRVTQSVDDVSGELNSRVASVASEVSAVREASMRQEERLATTDRLARRVAELEANHDDLGRRLDERPEPAPDDQDVRQELSAVVERLQALEQRKPDAEALARLDAIAHGQAGLRREVRELAVRTSELNARVEEAESMARAAGRAIAEAVRRSRGAKLEHEEKLEHEQAAEEPAPQE